MRPYLSPINVSMKLHAVILIAIALPYFVNLHRSALWDSNETYYAETSREMMESGDYLAPKFNFELRPQKPPLTYWLVVLGYKAAGVQELGVRLPGALAALGTILFTYFLGRLLYSPAAGLFAAAILGTTLRFFVMARKLPIDIVLLFWLAGAAYFFVRSMRRESRCDALLMYFFAALGCLTKGPVALVIPGLALLAWGWWARQLRWDLLCPWYGGAILAGVIAPWYLWTYSHYGWTYIADFFLKDNLARYATDILGPVRGPFYYFGVYFADFFPWSLLSLAAGFYLWSQRRTLRTHHALEYGFPLVWSAITLLLFSFSKNKQEYYIAPLYPVMAVLLAGVIDRSSKAVNGFRPVWRGVFAIIILAWLVLAALSPFLLPSVLPIGPAVLHYAPAAFLLAASMVLGWRVARGNPLQSTMFLAGSMWVIYLAAGAAYLPALEPLRPVKRICRSILEEAQDGDEIGYFRAAVPSMVFYLRRPIFSVSNPPAMEQKFRGTHRVFCVLGEQDLHFFKEDSGVDLYVLKRYRQMPTRLTLILGQRSSTGEGEELILVSNRPPRVQ
jgi:4-amino-4-deoxy-L-arabinose transferase-like glycosyltransferase